ncbi:response regulator transcription regulator protein [Herbaspirillum sp. GW103]|uniref:response regulator n=1 Tax=unclassified Herbaspirillum TaxID=2624150 RepID=UPI00025E4C73|nr:MULTISPECIES: response regulator [unclassified Herbaspirillum]EIJ46333.1 response regulator transcription regulator protein [Herbaspirillum sp. GW103]MCI1005988.1 response regulator [Herbaspirillum sp. C7C8]
MNFPSIIMIDPSQEAAELARFALWRAGLHCLFRSCPDLATARRCLLQGRRQSDGGAPSLILLESEMECGDGLQLLRELRASKHLAAAPVVVFPSHETEGERAALEAGATEYLPKPVDGEHYARCVVAMVERWCDVSEAAAPLAEAVVQDALAGEPAHPQRRQEDGLPRGGRSH